MGPPVHRRVRDAGVRQRWRHRRKRGRRRLGESGLGGGTESGASTRVSGSSPERIPIGSRESDIFKTMFRLRTRARLVSLIAVLAVLMGSLAPSLGHALAAGSGDSWVEVCTTQGSRWIQTGDDGSKRGPASAHAFEHCPCCSPHTPALGPLPEGREWYLAVGLAYELARTLLTAPRTLHAWRGAQPRAPPHSS